MIQTPHLPWALQNLGLGTHSGQILALRQAWQLPGAPAGRTTNPGSTNRPLKTYRLFHAHETHQRKAINMHSQNATH